MSQELVVQDPPPPSKVRELCMTIARPRVLDVLDRLDLTPVQMLCAPHGGGKTTALHQHAALHRDVGIVSLPPHASRAQVIACLASLAEARLIVIDQADVASPAGHDELFERIEANWPRGKCYLLSGSSRTRMRVAPLLARGIAAMVDASFLPFSSAEISELACALGVAADEMDVEQLQYDTDGWPVAVSWIVRDAARNGRGLRGAYEQWRERNGHLLLEYVATSHDDAESSEAFVSAISSLAAPASQRALERLEGGGYPIVRMRASLRPYRVLTQIVADAPAADRAAPAGGRLILNLFGRFSCKIENQAVAFVRRRDQNLLTFVALAPGASVTRAELLATFWPNAPRAVASQGLRTTLCRLRRAISNAAGCDAGRYLRVDESITLSLDWVSIDARSFRDCVHLAEAEDASGNRSAARDHYLQAEHLYTGTLLASEAIEPALAPQAAAFSHLFELVNATARMASRRVRADRRP